MNKIIATNDPKYEILYDNTCIKFKINDDYPLHEDIKKVLLDKHIIYHDVNMTNHIITSYYVDRDNNDEWTIMFFIRNINNENYCYILLPNIYIFI